MDKQLLEQLRALCRKTHAPQYRFPYPECREGWKSILIEAVASIEQLGVPWVASQIKEKFGTLRFYADILEPEESWISEVSKPDRKMSEFDETVMWFVEKTNAEKTVLYKQFYTIIEDVERKSAHICEECGNSDASLRDLSWIQTLCNSCYDKVGHTNEEENKEV